MRFLFLNAVSKHSLSRKNRTEASRRDSLGTEQENGIRQLVFQKGRNSENKNNLQKDTTFTIYNYKIITEKPGAFKS